jgi:ATPase subunit of ABC transporter with duplicated ATPase domains
MDELHRKMEAQARDERLVARWSRAHDAFEHAGGYAAESEARTLLAGLGLRADRVDGHIRALSGGERRRVELACILFSGSDLLLLDEPTNHPTTTPASGCSTSCGRIGALVVVSHDLELLDESITRVLHLDRPGEADVGEVTEYKGTYPSNKVARPGRGPPSQDRAPASSPRSPACRR